jgi:hypothetical protein
MKTGSEVWLKKLLKDKWETIRRHSDYIDFCRTCSFDEDGLLSNNDLLTQEADEIMARFGLTIIWHPSKNISEENLLAAFEEPLAVNYEWCEERPGHFTPIWDGHFIKLKIDISEDRKKGQILDEVWEFIEESRQVSGTKETNTRFQIDEDMYKVYDLYKAGRSHAEIIKEIWPDEFGDNGRDEYASDDKYHKLSQKYRKQGVADWEDRAYNEVYGKTEQIRLYMRVRDKLNRMEKQFDKY